ncbi:alpha/beta hydrolase fold domain-containing protein [Cellulomonas iranensis]|uniref:Acetyl esterase n=1 Tax=Cellulomonas iranensis TaxID=76862 RepID=A0ABU0GNL7_9CELL|nr:alpha/beta hydrolase fold domain-containing protein [Cellulomonas iranensis]MDQ0426961.1 acetyl esterase [Cellulomonas iranensis]
MTTLPDDLRAMRADVATQDAHPTSLLPGVPTGTAERVALADDAPVRALRVYRPVATSGMPAVIVNLHGGGFVLGDGGGDDPYCRFLADAAGCVVVNLEYPLAPEHPYPAAVHHVTDVLAWLTTHGSAIGVDGARLAVGGHSAGGNLAAAACLLGARRGTPRPVGLVVDYAPLDLVQPPAAKLTAAHRAGAAELAEAGARFNAWYLPDPARAAEGLASPLLADDLTVLPATLVVTAALDLLAAEGDAFAERLRAAGVATTHATFPGVDHGFTHAGPAREAAAAWHLMAGFLAGVLAPDAS